jgi:hypothetical protein
MSPYFISNWDKALDAIILKIKKISIRISTQLVGHVRRIIGIQQVAISVKNFIV